MRRLAACFAILSALGGARANGAGQCPRDMARKAEEMASTVANWGELYLAYKKYARCDDAAIGEGFSDSVGRLLSTDGGALRELFRLTKKDVGFERFVVKHVDETIPTDTLDAIRENLKRNCPRAATSLCRKMLLAVDP